MTKYLITSIIFSFIVFGCTQESNGIDDLDDLNNPNNQISNENCTGETNSSNRNINLSKYIDLNFIEEENNAISGKFIYNDSKFICTGSINDDRFGEDGNMALYAVDETFQIVWMLPKRLGRLYEVIHTSDNNYLAVGRIDDGDESKIYAVKTNLNGELIWEYTTEVGNNSDLGAFATTVIENPQGGYFIAGKVPGISNIFGFGDKSFVLLLNANGDLEWVNPLSTNSEPSDCLINKNGNLVVTFSRSSDLIINEINSKGELVRENSYGSSDDDGAFHVLQLRNDNYILTGYTRGADRDVKKGYDNTDIWVLKLDEELNLIQEQTFGGFGFQVGEFMAELEDGSLLLCAEDTGNVITVLGRRGPTFLRITNDLCLIDWKESNVLQDEYGLTDVYWDKNSKEIVIYGYENDRGNIYDTTDAFYYSFYRFKLEIE